MPFGPFTLQWRAPRPNPPTPPDLPEGITRTYIPTPSGPLELLTALPSSSSAPSQSNKPPLFFAHGGFGCASVWLPYLQYFSAQGYACYAMSYRGHGNSWYPGFWSMYFTGRGSVAGDLVAGVKFVERLERERRNGDGKVVLIAHSAGGALSQWVLGQGLLKVKGFCLCAAVPGFGSFSVYKFWAPIAPFHFPYRLFHPRYILATTSQIRAAFFTPKTPTSIVKGLEGLLSPYESMLWPLQGLFRFVKGPDVLASICEWGIGKGIASGLESAQSSKDAGMRKRGVEKGRVGGVAPRMLVLAGERDVLCTPAILLDAAERYREGFRTLVQKGEIEGVSESKFRGKEEQEDDGDSRDGVMYKVVKGAPHHLQNDDPEKSAGIILEWLRRL